MLERAPTHPGEILREDVLPSLHIGKAEFARRLHISRQMLYNILNEEALITPVIAVKLGALLGNGPTLWLNLQREYDVYYVNQELHDELQEIKRDRVA